ncbi:MAG TPA: BamA/TamA family outer membrane protein [Verrucomicrobiae bacterium]
MAHFFKVARQGADFGSQPPELWRVWVRWLALTGLCLLCLSPRAAAATSAPPRKSTPARISISGYGFLGNHQLKRILRTVELAGRKPEYFEAAFVEDAALILAARVKNDGYLAPSITIRLRLDEGREITVWAADLQENPLPQSLRIKRATFRIHKGILYHFSRLEFQGLESISARQARSYFVEGDTLLNLKSARVFTQDRLRRGVANLTEALDRQGYREATVEADRVARDDHSGSVSVRLTIRQGTRFFVRSVREDYYYGRSNILQSSRTVFLDQPYSKLWEQDYALSLRTNQYRLGYPDTIVEIETLERESLERREGLKLLARVKSGEQIRVGQTEFRGERRTRKGILSRRVRIERGELLDPIKVERGRSRIARLGIFDSVEFSYRPQGEGIRDILYEVKEGKRFDASLLFGYGSYEMLRGGVDLQAYNLWGLAHHAELKAVQSFKASSGGFTYTIPEVAARDLDLFVNASGLRREEISFTRLEYGGGAGLHKYFQRAATDLNARYNYQILNAQEFGPFPGIASEGLTNPAVGSILFELKLDRRDNPLYPRRGYKVFANIETATDYLGGDANFERVEIAPSWHKRLGGGRFLSLGLDHSVAVSFGSPANNLPFNRRFFPGGENSIRGFTEGEASPRNAAGQIVGAETFTLATVELEQALTPKWSIVLFSDNLGMAHRIQNYPWDTGLFSVGGGLRWRTLIGPVRLEYGYNLNPRPNDPVGALQFSLGFPF